MQKIEYFSSDNLFSKGGYCVYIEIRLRLGSVPIFRTLKNMSAVMLNFLMHIGVYRMSR